MSGYNMEHFIGDFAGRTKTNLDIINDLANAPARNQEVYEVTQLINSFLGLIVLPNEKFKKWDKKKTADMKSVEDNIWKLLRDCEEDHRYYNSYKNKNSGKVIELIDHFRNSISHSGKMGLHFYPVIEGGDKNITHIIFYDSKYFLIKERGNKETAEKNQEEFCLKMTVPETEKMAKYIANLYELVEKTEGKQPDYENAINAMEKLLSEGKPDSGKTVAAQLDTD